METNYEINTLRETLRKYADAYYNNDAPLVTDAEYDALMHQLRQMEAEHPELVTPDSPTQVVGGKRVIGIPVEHKVPMLSLLDVFETSEVDQFVKDVHSNYPDWSMKMAFWFRQAPVAMVMLARMLRITSEFLMLCRTASKQMFTIWSCAASATWPMPTSKRPTRNRPQPVKSSLPIPETVPPALFVSQTPRLQQSAIFRSSSSMFRNAMRQRATL
mgnify:CR=1 FL=1